MLTITIRIEERSGQSGPARKVDVKINAQGSATQAEEEYAEHFRPVLEDIMGAKAIDRSHGLNKDS